MTARSDDEIRADLAVDVPPVMSWFSADTSPVEAYHRAQDRLAADVPELLDSRERAIRWAVTLEGQLAKIATLHESRKSSQWATPHCRHDGHTWPCPTVAALTGSTQ